MSHPKPRRGPGGAFLAVVFLAALALRLVPYPAATAGGVRLLSPDCYAHLRRAALAVRQLPHVPVFDSFLNHPDGGVFIWPPLFDLAVAGASRAVAGPEAPLPAVAAVAASLPPLLGALHVVPLFFLARRLLGRTRAQVAVVSYALLPAAVTWSKFGHADHHVAEGLALLLLLLASARAAEATGAPAVSRAVVAGLAVALGLFVWQGFVFAAVLVFAWAFFALAPLPAAALGAAAAIATAAGTALALAGEPPVPFSFVSFGWFQPLFVAAAALPLALRAVLASKGRARGAATVAAALLALAVFPNAARLAGAVLRGGAFVAAHGAGRDGGPGGAVADDFDEATKGYLSYPRDLMSVIAEAQPLLPSPLLRSFPAAIANLSPGLAVLPWALFLWGRSATRRGAGARSRGRLLLVLFGGALLAMALSQRRNEYYLAIFAALALAEASARGLALLALLARRRARRRSGAPASRAFPAPRFRAAAIVAGIVLVVLPGRALLAELPGYREAPGRDFLALLSRLEAAAPPPGDPLALPRPAPGAWEGVFCPWTAGHFVTALSGRPAAADPNAYGWRRQCRLYTATDVAEAEALLREARCGWLLTVNLRPVLARYAAAAGRPGAPSPGETFAVRVHESSSRSPVPFLELLLDSRTATRTPDGRIVPAYRIWRVRTATGTEGATSRGPAS